MSELSRDRCSDGAIGEHRHVLPGRGRQSIFLASDSYIMIAAADIRHRAAWREDYARPPLFRLQHTIIFAVTWPSYLRAFLAARRGHAARRK